MSVNEMATTREFPEGQARVDRTDVTHLFRSIGSLTIDRDAPGRGRLRECA